MAKDRHKAELAGMGRVSAWYQQESRPCQYS